MENLELILSIIGSALGILATVISLINRKEIKEMKNINSNNSVKGDGNIQQSGTRNTVTTNKKD
ncbi:MAG: hypothetical protein LBV67_06165 [Streptococcaceae bacterium]|jgi:hypothetical protein|nr:hypothetical protein [Streptococcaceae bacterium]